MPRTDRPGARPDQAVSLAVVVCLHNRYDGHQGGAVCRGTLAEIPPMWCAKVRPLASRAGIMGWGVVLRCATCGRESEVLITGRQVA